MSNYRRFITYLFQYEKGEKRRQCGHARIEQRQNQGKIDFYIKDCGMDMGEVKPYFFARQGQVRIPIGTLTVKNRKAEGSFLFTCDPIGDTSYHFSQIQGIVLGLSAGRMIASLWEDVDVSWGTLQEMCLDVDPIHAKDDIENSIENCMEETLVASQIDTIPVQDVLMRSPSKAESTIRRSDREELEYRLCSLRPKHYPFWNNLTDWAIQAQLRDVRLLPKAYWQLSNNSFVLRGYFNYGSILIGYMETEKRFFVGVPGIFQKQERAIAGMFGFEHFRGQRSAEGKPGDFGYWYQLIDMV